MPDQRISVTLPEEVVEMIRRKVFREMMEYSDRVTYSEIVEWALRRTLQ